MADMKKCDRCKVIDFPHTMFKVELHQEVMPYADLCMACMKELRSWVYAGKKKEAADEAPVF